MSSADIFLSFHGRLDRERWLGAAALFVGIVVATYVATWILTRSGLMSVSWRNAIRAFVQTMLLVPWLAVDWKRFQDLGRSGAWAAICPTLVVVSIWWGWPSVESRAGAWHGPIGETIAWLQLAVAIWLAYALAYLKGEEGPNAYGPDPRGLASRVLRSPATE